LISVTVSRIFIPVLDGKNTASVGLVHVERLRTPALNCQCLLTIKYIFETYQSNLVNVFIVSPFNIYLHTINNIVNTGMTIDIDLWDSLGRNCPSPVSPWRVLWVGLIVFVRVRSNVPTSWYV
jgi:hypothetical protein